MRVLFIGNSHTYFNDMPATFANMWQNTFNEKIDVTMLAYSSRSLLWHDNEYFSVRFNLLHGHYDYCVIQQQAHPFPGEVETVNGLKLILELCEKSNTKPLLVETWPEKKIPENRDTMHAAYNNISKSFGIDLIPVGSIWQKIQNKYPDIDLYWKDGEHASIYGDYLIALTLFSVISGESVDRLSCNAIDFVGDNDIDFNNPKVREDINELGISLDSEYANLIKSEVSSYFKLI